MIAELTNFLSANAPQLKIKLIEQSYLVALSTGLALLIGIPLGILLTRTPRVKNFVMSLISALWTVPSLALLAFFIPFLGIGIKPAIITLAIYALLPILRNTVTGLEGVPDASIEAAYGLGFTNWQRLWMVELPLALPVMIAGIRTAVSIGVGVATLAAFIGAGGLGDFINQGLALNNTDLILLGAIPAAIMALVLDFIIGQIEKAIQTKHIKRSKGEKIKLTCLIIIIVGAFVFLAQNAVANYLMDRGDTIRIASKNFTESMTLAEMMTQLIEAKTKLTVIPKYNLGSTSICQAALLNGQIDMYPEYTGTAYLMVLKLKDPKSPQQVYQAVKDNYKKRFNLIWLKPFGFNNTEAIIVRQSFAKKFQLTDISDLIPIEKRLIIGAPAEFMKRPDGFIGLKDTYHLQFGKVRQMDPGLMYEAIKSGAVNVIAGFSTDGRIPAYHLVVLRDDKHFYPPYYAAPIIRGDVLKAHPEINKVLQSLFGTIDDATMQRLNYEVDIEKKSPAQVAREFLMQKGLL